MIAVVVVVIDEGFNVGLKISGEEVVFIRMLTLELSSAFVYGTLNDLRGGVDGSTEIAD